LSGIASEAIVQEALAQVAHGPITDRDVQ